MASDPYGFPEAPAASHGTPGDAVTGLWSGVAALALGAMAPCCCYLPWFVALPLSGAALYYGARASNAPDVGEGHRTAAQAGLVTGGIGLLLSLVWLGLFVFYAIYMLVIVGAVAAADM